jgi:5-formyltetrahydrofolate cyclo-ligase
MNVHSAALPADAVPAWRKAERARLLARRESLTLEDRREADARITGLLIEGFPLLSGLVVGFYWPFKGELDLRPLVSACVENDAEAALPVVVEKARPVQFWIWRPGMLLRRGIWEIPIPAEPRIARPTVLFVPLLGFDAAGYRLGYGGGYQDRTLAALTPRPIAIGIGYELGCLQTIHPQPHDIPMDAVVTEGGFQWFRYRGEELNDAALPLGATVRDPG